MNYLIISAIYLIGCVLSYGRVIAYLYDLYKLGEGYEEFDTMLPSRRRLMVTVMALSSWIGLTMMTLVWFGVGGQFFNFKRPTWLILLLLPMLCSGQTRTVHFDFSTNSKCKIVYRDTAYPVSYRVLEKHIADCPTNDCDIPDTCFVYDHTLYTLCVSLPARWEATSAEYNMIVDKINALKSHGTKEQTESRLKQCNTYMEGLKYGLLEIEAQRNILRFVAFGIPLK